MLGYREIPCYVWNKNTGTVTRLKFIPDSISDDNSAQFSDMGVRGRSVPVQGYESSGPRSISFSVMLHDDYCPNGILDTVRKLKALTYPKYASNVIAPRCFVRVGKFIRIDGICTDVSVNWQLPVRDDQYIFAEVSLTFQVTKVYPPSDIEVERGVDDANG